jgi:hypothetical protein
MDLDDHERALRGEWEPVTLRTAVTELWWIWLVGCAAWLAGSLLVYSVIEWVWP